MVRIKKQQHGGVRKGAGRKPSPYISKPVKLHFESEEEYRQFIKLTTPRERVEIVLKNVRQNGQIHKIPNGRLTSLAPDERHG